MEREGVDWMHLAQGQVTGCYEPSGSLKRGQFIG